MVLNINHLYLLSILTILPTIIITTPTNIISPLQHCPAEYYRNGTDTCRFCADDLVGCRMCTNGTECIECSDQYYLDGSGQCLLCINQINACILCSDQSTCTFCGSSHYVDAGSCSPCLSALEGCIQCYNSSTCI